MGSSVFSRESRLEDDESLWSSGEAVTGGWGDFPSMWEELAEEALDEGRGELPLSSTGDCSMGVGDSPLLTLYTEER